jgi:hypothetical protein
MQELINSLAIFGLILLCIGAISVMIRLAFKPLVRFTTEFKAHVATQDDKENSISEIIDLLKTQITSIDERENKATERMDQFIEHWKTSDQKYRQLFHELLAGNRIGKEQCRLHKMEVDLMVKTLKDHGERISDLELDMKTVKKKIA